MTLRNIAKKAGVAVDTVRKALREDPTVRSYLKERVLKAAEELDYYPTQIARALRAKKLNVVPLSVIEWENPYFGGLAYQISRRLADNNLDPVLCINLAHLAKICVTLSPCGSILGYGYSEDIVRSLSKRQKVVCIGSELKPLPGVGLVSLDFTNAYRSAAALLKRMGRKHVAVYSYQEDLFKTSKIGAIFSGLRQPGLNPVRNGEEDFFHHTTEISAHLLKHPGSIDAVICENDQLAAMLYGELTQRGIRIPDDVLIVGSDANHTLPGTWSVRIDTEVMAGEAVGLLLRLLDGEKNPEPRVYLPVLVNAAGKPF